MKHYEVRIYIEEIDGDQGHTPPDMPYDAGRFTTEAQARRFVENELMTTRLSGSAVDLLEACKGLTSYTSQLLRQLNDQVDMSDIEEIQQAKAAIAKYRPADVNAGQFQVTLQEQSPLFEPKTLVLHLAARDGQLWIRPHGYGEKCAPNGEGSPVGLEIWEDRLRVVVFDDIHSENPRIIDLENARESNRDAL